MTATDRAGRHLHAVPTGRVLPWWCRTFGHTYVSRATQVINQTRFYQPSQVPAVVMCRRCGDRP